MPSVIVGALGSDQDGQCVQLLPAEGSSTLCVFNLHSRLANPHGLTKRGKWVSQDYSCCFSLGDNTGPMPLHTQTFLHYVGLGLIQNREMNTQLGAVITDKK